MISSTHADSNDLEAMFQKIEGDAAKFARYFESLLMTDKKCSSATQSACMGGNYDDCASEYPEASCPGNEYAIPVCGDGNEGGCGALFDFTASTVRLSPDIDTFESSGNPVDLSVQETVCTTLQADEYMREQTVQNKEFWDDYSVSPPWYHYGADDGVFRIYPGNPKKCPSDYDPRLRPWYVAASSGPKDVVLLLDTSGSMRDYGRMDVSNKSMVVLAMDIVRVFTRSSSMQTIVFANKLNSPITIALLFHLLFLFWNQQHDCFLLSSATSR